MGNLLEVMALLANIYRSLKLSTDSYDSFIARICYPLHLVILHSHFTT